jgi:hypothetical protein
MLPEIAPRRIPTAFRTPRAGAFRRSELGARRCRPGGNRGRLQDHDLPAKDRSGSHGETVAIARGVTACPREPSRHGCRPPASARTRCSAPSPRAAGSAPSGSQIKACARRQGLCRSDRAQGNRFRRPFPARRLAARRGASVFKMRDVSRHKSMDVLQAYVRDADLFRDHAGAGLL